MHTFWYNYTKWLNKLKCVNTFVPTSCRVSCDLGKYHCESNSEVYLVYLVLHTLICSTPVFLRVIVIIVLSFLPSTSSTPLTTVDFHHHPHLMGSVKHNIGITLEVVKSRTKGFVIGLNIVDWNGQSCMYLCALVSNFLIWKFVWEYLMNKKPQLIQQTTYVHC